MENLDLIDKNRFTKKELNTLKYFIKNNNESKMKNLVVLYNQGAECLEEVIKYFIECYAPKMGYFTYIYNGKRYFGLQNLTDKIREKLCIPIGAISPEEILRRIENEGLVSPMNNALDIGFVEGYSKKLYNGNVEYLMINPLCNSALYFELTEEGILDNKYNLSDTCPLLIPFSYIFGNKESTIVTYRSFDRKTPLLIDRKRIEKVPEWPPIILGKDSYFISTEDEMVASNNNMSNKQRKLYYSIMMLKKINTLPRELQEMFGGYNIVLAQDVVDNLDKYTSGITKLKEK